MGESFTIQISSNLVKQLLDDGEKSKKKTRKPKTKVPRDPQPSQTKVHQKQFSDDSDRKRTEASGWPLQPPLFLPVSPPPQLANSELDAIRSVAQGCEKTVERLHKQEENMLQELTQRAKELRDKEFKLPSQKPIACVAEKDACLDCYKEHVKDPLKCAHFVEKYADCARRVRQQADSADK
ncbi:uncharacterized protein LOC132282364 [Cornus florida]|uniref:uncharacterized protein LOC132282364 n=1 Tax=Cornus florida TaxID=4283 RepID=UPI00289FE36A|nr:uncharacterized protein LOC132282364 [Cornus florida]XP_059640000.1 uncharacterized protein LOC132282364 [Cornus florida]